MAELVPQYLDNDAIAVIEGDGAVSQELIAQGFDQLCSPAAPRSAARSTKARRRT